VSSIDKKKNLKLKFLRSISFLNLPPQKISTGAALPLFLIQFVLVRGMSGTKLIPHFTVLRLFA
jgi:hypothetical protein